MDAKRHLNADQTRDDGGNNEARFDADIGASRHIGTMPALPLPTVPWFFIND
jgi:hypothetical protein